MKTLKLLLLLMIFILPACKLDPPYVRYENMVISIDELTVPETGSVSVPLNIYANATVYNSCWSDISFVFKKDSDSGNDFEYFLYATADFESYGQCPELTISADTLITLTPATEGDYVITVRTSSSTYERDTIVVGGEIPIE
jgi:hypothetical protein